MGAQLIERVGADETDDLSTEPADDEEPTLDDIIETYSRSE